MIDPAILRALQAAGATTDMIIAAVEADVAIEAERLERKREGNRERQRRYREAHKDDESNASNALHTLGDVTNGDDLPAPDKSPPDPQKLTPTPRVHTRDAREANPFPRPEWADRQVWADFLANRKRRRMVNTATAHKQFLGDVARLADDEWPPGRLLEHAAAKGWGSINDPRGDNGRSNTNGMGRNQPANDGLSPTTRAALRVFGTGPGDERRIPQ